MRTAPRIQTAFRFDAQLLNGIKAAAKRENRSLNGYVEHVLYRQIKDEHTPNAETIAAIEEVEKGIGLKKADMSSFEAFMKSAEIE